MKKIDSIYQKKRNSVKMGFLIALLTTMFFSFTGFMPVYAETKTEFLLPNSFSNLAKQVGPAVVNIRTEKVIKGGGRVFRHYFLNPERGKDPFQDFF